MNLLFFFGFLLTISFIGGGGYGQSSTSFLTSEANDAMHTDYPFDHKDENQTETSMQMLRAGDKISLSFYARCACGKGAGLALDITDAYIAGEVLYYADKTDNSKIVKRKEFVYAKKHAIKDNMNPSFLNFITISTENKYNVNQIGAYVELWDSDTLVDVDTVDNLDKDDFLGSFKFRREKVKRTINTETKSMMFNEPGLKADAVKCPNISLSIKKGCEGLIATGILYFS